MKDVNNQLGSEGGPWTLGPGYVLDMYKNTKLYLNDGRVIIHILQQVCIIENDSKLGFFNLLASLQQNLIHTKLSQEIISCIKKGLVFIKEKFPNVKPSAKINYHLGALPALISLIFGLTYVNQMPQVAITFSNNYSTMSMTLCQVMGPVWGRSGGFEYMKRNNADALPEESGS